MPKYDPVEDFLFRARKLTPEQKEQIVLDLSHAKLDEQKEARQLGEIVPIMEGSSFQEVEEQFKKGDTVEGLSTGYWTLDRMTAGLVPGELIVLTAESGIGKTLLCVNMAARQLALGYRILIISLENTVKSIRRRLRGVMGPDYFKLLVGDDNIFIQKFPQIPSTSIKYAIESAKKKGVQVVYIDHLQYLQTGIENPVEEIGRITKECKTLSQEYELPIILVSQVRKLEKGAQIGADDLYGSVKIRQTADIILIGDKDPQEFTQHVRVTVHKQRDRVLWRLFSSVKLAQIGFDLEEPPYNEEMDITNDVMGKPRGKGTTALTFRE